jgi:hypothetical protein
MLLDGKYDHIEDVLVFLHPGQWFGWSDYTNKIYANLIIHNSDYDKPSEKSLTDALATQRSNFDSLSYARNRSDEYNTLNQFELMTDDAINSTTTHLDAIAVIKTKWPKDNSGPIE